MQTRFDQIADGEIEASLRSFCPNEQYTEHMEDLKRIVSLAWWMSFWKSWLGPPVTYYESAGNNYDGHHRVRACKYLARRGDLQIQIPVRYAPEMK